MLQPTAGTFIEQPAWSPDGTHLAWWQRQQPAAGSTDSPVQLETGAVKAGATPQSIVSVANSGEFQVSWQAGNVNAGTRPVLDRIGGQDRRGTAIAASQWSYGAVGTGGRRADVAVLSRDDQYADALSGNALAARKFGPLLLTQAAAGQRPVRDVSRHRQGDRTEQPALRPGRHRR